MEKMNTQCSLMHAHSQMQIQNWIQCGIYECVGCVFVTCTIMVIIKSIAIQFTKLNNIHPFICIVFLLQAIKILVF